MSKTIDDACEHDFVVDSSGHLERENGKNYLWGICTDCNVPVRYEFSSYECTQWLYNGIHEILRGQVVKGKVERDSKAKYKDGGFHPIPQEPNKIL